MTPAHAVPSGSLVRHQGREWLKAERDSKDYVNHYLVGVQAEPDLTLLYIDPDIELEILAPSVRPEGLAARAEGQEPCFGDLLATETGRHFIKALDIKKDGQRHLAYVDIQSGEIRPRQERGRLSVFSAWHLK